MICELFKNKGSEGDINNYRDVFLGDFDGKAVFKSIRRKILPLVSPIVGHSQYGSGFNGGETAFAHIGIRLHFETAKTFAQSASGLFLDVVSAFACLLTRILF